MERWLIEITGDAFDVDEFPFWFPSGDAYAITENGKVFLLGEIFEAFIEASEVHEAAVQMVDEYFAIIRLLQPELKTPTVGVVFREHIDGRREGFAFFSEVAAGRSKLRVTIISSGEQEQSTRPTQAQEFLAASRSDRRLQVAVSLISIPNSTWPHLYRCLEEIEFYLGRNVNDEGLCSKKERERFTRTANSAEVSGRDSRHRLEKYEAPKDPMSISEARNFVSGILQTTLRTVASRVA